MAETPKAQQAAQAAEIPVVPEGLDGVMAQSRMLTDMASTFGAELLRFASRRMEAQAELLAGLARCRTAQDVLERQMDFVRRAGSDYADEFSVIADSRSHPPTLTDLARHEVVPRAAPFRL